MSMFSDDSLAAVVNQEGGGARASTPQMKRTTSRRQRQTTPQRAGSAPRSSSANKVSALAKACFDSQSCNRSLSRTAGRKKQQRWENDNLFGLNMFMKRVDALNKQHRSDEDGAEGSGHGGTMPAQGLSLNWQSLFGTLTNGEHEGALEAYLMCSSSFRSAGAKQSRSIRDCCSEWERAEFAWMKVEKRLRSILLQALGREDGEAQAFVAAVEALLLSLEGEQDAPSRSSDAAVLTPPPAAAHLFPRPPCLEHPGSPTHSREDTRHSDSVMVISRSRPQLVITLIDSAFHRLLLHATCQFHHMHSSSFTDKKNGGARATRISPFQSQKCRHTISLLPFVLLKLSAMEHKDTRKPSQRGPLTSEALRTDKENSPENCRGVSGRQQQERDEERRSVKSADQSARDSMLTADGPDTLEREHNDRGDETDDGEDDDDDEEEYCLVDIVAPSGGHCNPIESREI